jgi:hypothetical protein
MFIRLRLERRLSRVQPKWNPAGSLSHNNKSSLLLSFKKEDSSFLKKRSKRLLMLTRELYGAFLLCAMT